MSSIELLAMVTFCNMLATTQPVPLELGADCVIIREHLIKEQGGYTEFTKWANENKEEAESIAEEWFRKF